MASRVQFLPARGCNRWARALGAGQLAVAPPIVLELLFSTRSPEELARRDEQLGRLRVLPLNQGIARTALGAIRELAAHGPGRHRIAPVDLLVAAAAQQAGLGVLHYDHHYDRLAEVLSFESRWVAPPGSL